MALLDLDGFKAVNDSRGHAAGDDLLVLVAARLTSALPVGWTAARLGGDEFAVVLRGMGSDAQALVAAQALLRAVSGPAELNDGWVEVTASIGVVLAGPAATPQDLLRNADVAMYAAKDAGREGREGTARLFLPQMREALLDRVTMEADLRQALAAGQVVPWFQPIVELPGGRVRGVEALARWTRADGTEVSPAVFVPLAETCGLVVQLGRAILLAACEHAGQWHQAAADGLLDHAPSLIVEVTETALVQDPVVAGQRLAALRELGVRVALDDFGTGYSALGALQSMPVDIVKIDRAFVRDLHLGPREAALATAVLTLADSLGLAVIAEGVELPALVGPVRIPAARSVRAPAPSSS